ncbi:flagellar basal body-associated protein FliL [Halobacteriovorax sp. ZH4_bin.1]|uniref:flagellar basal body-associated FliL family protein n=1 Tax=unclassified Halobacteriovorax TaxID=2639665 RepID=UPI00370FE7E3
MADGSADNSYQGSGKNPLLTVALLLNIVLMGVIAYFQYQTHLKISEQSSVEDIVKAQMAEQSQDKEVVQTGEAQEEEGKLFPLDSFTANLAQGDGPQRYIRLNAVLKLSLNAKEEEYKARKPQIRDSIISILNSKRPNDLLKVQGKEYLKEEIKSAINSYLVDGKVLDVYYVGFQIN